MIILKNKFYKKIMFWYEITPPFENNIDFIEIKSSIKKESIFSIPFHTIFVNLNQNEKDIFNGFNKTTKYEIHRALEKDKIEYSINLIPEKSDIDAFVIFYNKFAERKGLGDINEKMLKLYHLNNSLVISTASFEDKILIYHCYLKINKTLRLLKSANTINEPNVSKGLVGRANRFLHWKDILEFKLQNFDIYDFGGIYLGTKKTNLISITEFKFNFSKNEVKLYDSLKPITLWGRLICPLIFLKRILINE